MQRQRVEAVKFTLMEGKGWKESVLVFVRTKKTKKENVIP